VRHALFLLLSISILSAQPVIAETWNVPLDAPTIQAGFHSAAAGDTVRTGCGTYYEHDIAI